MVLTTEKSEEYNGLAGDINLEDGLDNFIKTIKDMGIERCVEIQQAAYDRYQER